MNRPRKTRRILWPWLLAILVVGLVVVFSAAGTRGVSTGSRQLEHTQASWQLYDGHSVGQVLRINPSQMVGIRVWLERPSQITAGTLTARLYSFEHQRDVATATTPIEAVRFNQPTDIQFVSIEVEGWSQEVPLTIELRISTEGVPESAALTAYGSNNRYPNGPVVVDGEQDPSSDLAFAVLYPGTWLDEFLPVTHIAEDRPGIFGWPPLYGLLAWLTLWTAASLLLLLIRFIQIEE